MTEDEAKQKWCPFGAGGKTIGQLDAEGQRLNTFTVPSTCRCIASDCMAWRWSDTRLVDLKDGQFWGQNDGHMRKAENPPHDRRGYCGLAGKP